MKPTETRTRMTPGKPVPGAVTRAWTQPGTTPGELAREIGVRIASTRWVPQRGELSAFAVKQPQDVDVEALGPERSGPSFEAKRLAPLVLREYYCAAADDEHGARDDDASGDDLEHAPWVTAALNVALVVLSLYSMLIMLVPVVVYLVVLPFLWMLSSPAWALAALADVLDVMTTSCRPD